MNRNEFWEEIITLRQVYGEDSYPDKCAGALWQEIGHVSKERFSKAITRILADNPSTRYPPGISKIEKMLGQIREEKIEKEKEKFKSDITPEMASKMIGEIFKEAKL